MRVTIPKDDLSALAEALHWEDERVDDRSSIIYGPRTPHFHVSWSNMEDTVTVEGDLPELLLEVTEYVELAHWEINQLRAKGKKRKAEKRLKKLQPIERVLHILLVAVQPKKATWWVQLLAWIGR